MQFRHLMVAFLCVSLWGLNLPLIKMIALEMPPLFSAALRLILMGFGVFFIQKPREIKKLLLLGTTLFALTLGPTTVAIKHVDATVVAFLNELEVPLAAILGFFFLGESFGKRQIAGLLIAFFGVGLIVWSPEIASSELWAVALLLVSAFCYGFSAIYVKFLKNTNAISLTLWCSLFAACELFLGSLFFEHAELSQMTVPPIKICFALVGSSCTNLLAFFGWNYLLQLYKVNQVIPFAMLLPVFSLFFSYFLLGEMTEPLALFGGCLTLVGVWIQSHGTNDQI